MVRTFANVVASGRVLAALGVGLIRSHQENYDRSHPGVDYLVDGELVLRRRFSTQEEFDAYLNSQQGKQEREHYSNLNARTRSTK